MFMEAACAALLAGDVAAWRELARDNFERDIGPILRPTQRASGADSLLKRAEVGWGRIFDFGTIRVSDATKVGTSTRATVRVDGFDGASLAFRHVHIGTTIGLLRSAGLGEVGTRWTAGEGSFGRDFEYEVTWASAR